MKKILRPHQDEAVDAIFNSKGDVLLNITVGGGKTLTIAEAMERYDGNVLCLAMNRELVSQNSEEYKGQGYTQSAVYCAGLGRKQWGRKCLFASPQSLIGVLRNPNHSITKTPLQAIFIDECHNVNDYNDKTTYMKIISHFRSLNPDLRVIGLTGTAFRDGENYIVGPDRLFKEQLIEVSVDQLIAKNYLVRPIYVNHEGDESHLDGFDFSDCEVDRLGNFKEEELEAAIGKDQRLTGQIMREVEMKTRGLGGTFIFASTIRHCTECLEALPPGSAAVVTGKTPSAKRARIMNEARAGKIRFLINVGVLTTGVNLPWFGNIVFVRPTSSRTLYLQAIGRGLRILEGKKECRVFDYAGNYETHGTHIFTPKTTRIKKLEDVDSGLQCPECYHDNKVTARRCKGEQFGDPCEFYFQGKECPKCETTNDHTARYCRACDLELVDPNDKLTTNSTPLKLSVTVRQMEVNKFRGRLRIIYTATNGSNFTESVALDDGRIHRLFGGDPLKVDYPMVKKLKLVKKGKDLTIVRRLK